jgi:chromosome partitioning protein
MRVVAIAQQKGGVGKTTSSVNIAAAIAQRGQRVLLVDADPQGSATLALGTDPNEVEVTIGDAMLSGLPVPTQPTQVQSLDLCPASRLLADTEFLLVPKTGRERFMARALDEVRGDYDWVIIDSPPSLGLITINALVAAQYLFVPVTPALLSAAGLRDLLQTIEEVRQGGLNPKLMLGGIFVTFADQRTIAAKRTEGELREDLGELVMNATISRRVAHEYAAQAGLPAIVADPNSTAAHEYRALVEEVMERANK